jgi:hypothetical protein
MKVWRCRKAGSFTPDFRWLLLSPPSSSTITPAWTPTSQPKEKRARQEAEGGLGREEAEGGLSREGRRAAWAEKGGGQPGQRRAEGVLGREGRRVAWAERGGGWPGQRGADCGLGREETEGGLDREEAAPLQQHLRIVLQHIPESFVACSVIASSDQSAITTVAVTSAASKTVAYFAIASFSGNRCTCSPHKRTRRQHSSFSNLKNVSYGTKITSVRTLDTPWSSTVEALP